MKYIEKLIRRPVRIFFTILFRLCYGYRVTGKGFVPSHGPVLMVSNHQSYWDPLIIASRLRRYIRFAAMLSLFKIKILAFFLNIFGTISLDRDNPDKSAYQQILKLLKNKEAVAIFPEGTRTRDGNLQPLKTGFVRLAIRTGAPIQPVVITGAFDVWSRHMKYPRFKGRIAVKFYKPIELPPDYQNFDREQMRQLEADICSKITRILQVRNAAWQRLRKLKYEKKM